MNWCLYKVGHRKVARLPFAHVLATVLISVFMLCYRPGLLFRGPLCSSVLGSVKTCTDSGLMSLVPRTVYSVVQAVGVMGFAFKMYVHILIVCMFWGDVRNIGNGSELVSCSVLTTADTDMLLWCAHCYGSWRVHSGTCVFLYHFVAK
jgi:hypothetical protein